MKKAFTLAEVLITLGIIGVVAAMTIPTLITQYNERVNLTKIKQTVNILHNGMKLLAANSGGNLQSANIFTDTIDTTYYENLDKAIKSTFKTTKTYTETEESNYKVDLLNGNAGGDARYNLGLKSTYSNTLTSVGDYQFDLYNGARIAIFNQKCKPTNYPEASLAIPARCGTIYFDINGTSEPNIIGRDIFGLVISSTGDVFPTNGIEFAKYMSGDTWETSIYWWKNNGGNARNCTFSSTSQGYACLARLMENNWVFDY